MENIKNTQVTSAWLNNNLFFNPEIKTEPSVTKKNIGTEKVVRTYRFKLYVMKKSFQLRNSWMTYSNKTCPRCKTAIRKEQLGKGKSMSYFCYNCQLLFRK